MSRTGAGSKRDGSTLHIDIDESSDKSVQVQLREALRANSARVIDLFRDWDDNQSGTVDKQEWRKAMFQLGFDVSLSQIDALFTAFDPDGSGSVDYRELSKLLQAGAADVVVADSPSGQFSKKEELQMELDEKIAEVARTEAIIAEYESSQSMLQRLEDEIGEMRKQVEKVQGRLSADERSKTELEAKAKAKGGGDMSHCEDPALLQAAIESERKRNVAMRRQKGSVDNPQARTKQEESLDKLVKKQAVEQKRLQHEEQRLRQVERELETMNRKVEETEATGLSQIEVAKSREAYIKRLLQTERQAHELLEKREQSSEQQTQEWARWIGLLGRCASMLKARADAGEEAARITALKDAGPSPAVNVLEAVRRGEDQRVRLEARLEQCSAKKEELENKLSIIHVKVDYNKKPIRVAPAKKGSLPPID